MLIIYMLNIHGEVLYGETEDYNYPNVVCDALGRGFSISVIETVPDTSLNQLCREHVCLN